MIPKVTVVIPFYNCPYIDLAVQSAIYQTYPSIELIVVSDGSTMYEEKLLPYRDQIRYIRKTNGGTASALNTGFQAAKGEYIAWLSSDDMLLPNKISKQVNFMRYFQAVFSYTNFDHMDASSAVTDTAVSLVFASFLELYRAMLERNPVNGSTVMMHRSLYQATGPFDEALRYTHDYDYWLRIIQQGWHLYYLHDCLTWYRRHDQMGTVLHRVEIEREVKHTKARHEEPMLRYLAALERGEVISRQVKHDR